MDIEKLRKQLEIDEGIVHEIYLDHLGYPTFGIGHLVRESDPEHGADVGTAINETRCIEVFNEDVETVIKDCKILYPDFDDLPEEVQQIVANKMKQWLEKFKIWLKEGNPNNKAPQYLSGKKK